MNNVEQFRARITRTLFISQSVFSAGFISMSTVNSIVGAELSGRIAWAGLPVTILLTSAALGALAWGFLNERVGRRVGLGTGLVLGSLGALTAAFAIWQEVFGFYLLGMVLVGLAQSAMQLGRFAAAEVNPPERRGNAIATVVLGGTVGSIAGPLLVGPAGRLSMELGLNELLGPFGTALLLFSAAAVVVFIWLRPEPTRLAREIASNGEEKIPLTPARKIGALIRKPAVVVAILSTVIGQAVMVMIMVITGLHMKNLAHPLTSISAVISSHTFGMYAFSIISGRLTDSWGRGVVISLGSAILVLAGLTAGLSPRVLPLALSLFLLGLGWNLCYVGGSTLLADQLSVPEQSRMQGFNDLLIGLASALGSLGSGFVFAAVGFQQMGFLGALFALLPLGAGIWWIRQNNKGTRSL